MLQPERPYIFDIKRIYDPRGSLSFIQNGSMGMPFEIKRIFWIYDVPAGESRGAHGHKETCLILVALSGSFAVNVTDGTEESVFTLDRPYKALYIPPGYWHILKNFTSGSVCVALASTLFSEEDYLRDFDEFLAYRKRLAQ